jgi:anti-sigma regulatory factor (Ser/Thr protein kinase)
MIHSMSSADVADPERFERIGVVADPESAARTREEFAEWLERFFTLDPIRVSDLVLAINEALANAAEFAYLLTDRPGTMDVQAAYDPSTETLKVKVADQGLWRMPDPAPATRNRGRGIPLMRALTDCTSIQTSTGGTQVCMEWNGVHPS